MDLTLAGRAAIVTGGAQGIGRAIARGFARDGASVVIADLQGDKAEAEAAGLRAAGLQASAVEADVGDPAGIEAMVADTVERFGRVDILVNNAYHSARGSADGVDAADWDRGFHVMVRSMGLAARAVAPHMRSAGGGNIVNISSVHGLLAATDSVIYETCKHAVIGITRALAVDLGPDNIRVNAICPGAIVTEVQDVSWRQDPERVAFDELLYPLRRVGRPHDIAAAVRFLVSDQAAFITGHALAVDGGLSIQLQDSLAARVRAHRRSDAATEPPRTPPVQD